MSPENTTTVFLPFSVIVNSRLDEPRMCPASNELKWNSGETSKGAFRGACFINFKTGSISWVVRLWAPCISMLLRVPRIFFLQVCRVSQQQRGQLDRRRVRVDRPAKSRLHEHRKPSR